MNKLPKIQAKDPELNRVQAYTASVLDPVSVALSQEKEIRETFGEIWQNNEAGDAVNVLTTGVFVPWTSGKLGEFSNIVPSVSGFRIATPSGLFRIVTVASVYLPAAKEVQMAVFANGEETHMRMDEDSYPTAAYLNIALTGLYTCRKEAFLDLRFCCTGAPDTVYVRHVNFNIQRVK